MSPALAELQMVATVEKTIEMPFAKNGELILNYPKQISLQQKKLNKQLIVNLVEKLLVL